MTTVVANTHLILFVIKFKLNLKLKKFETLLSS